MDNCDAEVSIRLAQKLGSSSVMAECAVEATIILPEKCQDFSVPCSRFLDLPSVIYIGARPIYGDLKIHDGFIGCIKNLEIDGKLSHFSEFDSFEKVGSVWPGCQKFRPDLCIHSTNKCLLNSNKSLTGGNAKCVDKWEGHLCKCSFRVHSKNGCSNSGKILFFNFTFCF